MAGLRAYALAVGELRGVVGVDPAAAGRLRALAGRVLGAASPAPSARDPLGPLYRRVPGAPVVRPDDPTRRDLDTLLAGLPVPPDRVAATWRLVEALVAGLAWAATDVDAELAPVLLLPVGLPLALPTGVTLAWCPLEAARDVPGLRAWAAGGDAWRAAAVRAGRPAPDVVVLGRA